MEAGARQPRRPLLSGGEHLAEEIERAGGGGGKNHPRSLEQAIAHLTPQYERLAEQAASIPSEKRGRRIVIEAEVLPNYLANSDFPKELFAEADLVPVGTKVARGTYRTPKKPPEERETKNYLLAGDERSFALLGDMIRGENVRGARGERARLSLRQFELLRVPRPQDTLRMKAEPPIGDLPTWEAVFHPAFDRRRTPIPADEDELWQKWLDLVGSLGGAVAERYARQISDLVFVPIQLPREAAEEAASFNPLRTLRPMPAIRPVPISPLRTLTRAAPAAPPGDRPVSDVRVAVFDGGVDEGALVLRPFVESADLTDEPPDPNDLAHGSVVTATILFGADHGAANELQTPEVGVDHFRVLPVARDDLWDLDLYRILGHIVTQLRGGAHKIVNLSIGPNSCLDDDEPHAWTAQLDELAHEEGILFLNAVGNDGTAPADIGADRIQAPSDMVNGIGVGACDRRSPEESWARAPYSSVGPGRPGCRMQPTGLSFGGVEDNPFHAIGPAGAVLEANGTSLATPTAVHGLAGLSAQLGAATADPSVLRAFAAHFAEPPDEEDLHAEVGFGRLLERYDGILECRPNEVTILYRDEIERGEMRSLLFPLISEEIGNHMVDLRWTIAFATPTDPKDSADYTQAGLEMAFRPHFQVRNWSKRGTRRSGQINIVTEKQEAALLISEGFSISTIPKAAQARRWRHEALRRQEDGKWETIHRATAKKRASSLHRPQVTALYLAREEGDLVEAEPLRFAMLLSMSTAEGVPLYDSVRTAYPVLDPLRPHLPLRLTT
jgi:hypothetical protein